MRSVEKKPSGTTSGRTSANGRMRAVAGRLFGARESGVFSALLVLVVVGLIVAPGFSSPQNLLNIGQQVSQIGIMAVGMTFVIVTGQIDLSVGAIYALAAVVTGLLITGGAPILVAIAAGLAVGFAAGLFNGVATVYLGVPSFIVTLGTLSAFRGLTLLLTNGSPISLNGDDPGVQAFSLLAQGYLFGVVPMEFVFLLLVFAVGYVLLARTRYGYYVYAVGGSAEAARLCGINVPRVQLASFVLLGTLSAFAGILGLSFLNYVQGVTGEGLELAVISAVIIGGTALFGGSGTMLGTFIGVILIGVLQNILVLSGLSSFWQILVVGLVVILAVALDSYLRRSRGAARSAG